VKSDQVMAKRILVVKDDIFLEKDDYVAVETPLTIYLNGREIVTLLCTPEKTDKLALGFLRSEGLLESMDGVHAVRVDETAGKVEVEVENYPELADSLLGKRTVTSGCGKGTIFFNVLDSLHSYIAEDNLVIKVETVFKLMRILQAKADKFKLTGGFHSAALFDMEELLFFSEDIGRHNAFDKIVGECLTAGILTDNKLLVTSGRLSSEILLKAAKLRIPVLISRSAPTSLSLEVAEQLRITVIGFVRGKRFNVYTHGWRVSADL